MKNSQRVVEPQVVTMDTNINNRDPHHSHTYHKELHNSTGTNNNNDNDNQAVGSELRDIVRSEMRKIVQVGSISNRCTCIPNKKGVSPSSKVDPLFPSNANTCTPKIHNDQD